MWLISDFFVALSQWAENALFIKAKLLTNTFRNLLFIFILF